MKPDLEYLKQLLTAFQSAPDPTIDIEDLKTAGLAYDDPKFEFHMRLLQDQHFVESDLGGIGLSRGADGGITWSVVPLRLTASGHEFAEALGNSKVVQTLKDKFAGASIATMSQVAVAIFKVELAKHTGLKF
ncbi:MAG TPA: hypothetical protein VMI10_10670 [Terriglobales bacterium]|nr:hypothetical protein [Terriglobales bacterium]